MINYRVILFDVFFCVSLLNSESQLRCLLALTMLALWVRIHWSSWLQMFTRVLLSLAQSTPIMTLVPIPAFCWMGNYPVSYLYLHSNACIDKTKNIYTYVYKSRPSELFKQWGLRSKLRGTTHLFRKNIIGYIPYPPHFTDICVGHTLHLGEDGAYGSIHCLVAFLIYKHPPNKSNSNKNHEHYWSAIINLLSEDHRFHSQSHLF